MGKKDKAQGVVFVLPKSKEFFGRINDDLKKQIQSQQEDFIKIRETELPMERTDDKSVEELKSNLNRLMELHQKLQALLADLENLLEVEEEPAA